MWLCGGSDQTLSTFLHIECSITSHLLPGRPHDLFSICCSSRHMNFNTIQSFTPTNNIIETPSAQFLLSIFLFSFNIRHSQGQSWVLLPFATLCLQEMQPSHRVHHQGRDMWIITSPRRLLTLKECKHYTPYSTPVICETPGKISESCDMLSRKDRHQSERT